MNDAPDDWTCPACGERIDAAFTNCWRCGSDRAGGGDPTFVAEVGKIQDRTVCAHCGYALRGLTRQVCPECGTLFDPEIRDTLEPPVNEQQREAERSRRRMLILSLLLWLFAPLVAVLLINLYEYQPRAMRVIGISYLCVAVAVPGRLILRMLR